jgi:aspartate racemase
MFDTYNHNGTAPQLSVRNRLRYLRQKVQFHWVNVARLPSKERIAYLGEKLRGASEREIEKISIKLDNLSKLFGSRVGKANIGIVLEDVNDQAGHSYRPKAYPGEISLFVPQRNYAFMSKPRMGWTEFAVGGLNIIELPVYPGGMFIEPYVQTLADKLRVCIDEAQKSHVATSATS